MSDQLSPGTADNVALRLRGVTKRAPDRAVLEDVSLTVRRGALFGLVGPNGSGKTTLIKTAIALLEADGGSVEILGLDPRRSPVDVRRRCGVLFDDDGIYENLTVWDNLDFFARAYGLSPADRADRIAATLEELALSGRRKDPAGKLSKGMRKALAIGRAMLHRPELLLLDEPFAALDPDAADSLCSRLRASNQRQGTTILLSSHDLEYVEAVCGEVALLRGGKIMMSGPIGDLLSAAPPEGDGRSSLQQAYLRIVRRAEGA